MEKRTIGILGDGQLAQMTCLAGQALGFEMHVYASHQDNPAALVADRVWVGELSDASRLAEFARAVSVVTYDTELLPIDGVRLVASNTAAYPHPDILWIAQNRIREKSFLNDHDIPTARVQVVECMEDLVSGVGSLGVPCVIKTAEQGYDGKGQVRIDDLSESVRAYDALGHVPCILEEWLQFEREMSVIVAGSLAGEYTTFPVIDNIHKNHILHISSAPSTLPHHVQELAKDIAIRIAKAMNLVGLLTIEMFHTKDGRVLVNELAPRPHNSGHHTQRSAKTSQFEQLCRAITGAKLGETVQRPAAMVNLLGDLFVGTGHDMYQSVGFINESSWDQWMASKWPDVSLSVYFYGKKVARSGRKMGHAIAVSDDREQALRAIMDLYDVAIAASGRN